MVRQWIANPRSPVRIWGPPFENYNYNLDNYFIKCYTQYIVVKKLYLVCKELVTEVTSGKFESSFINFQNYKQYYDSNLINTMQQNNITFQNPKLTYYTQIWRYI